MPALYSESTTYSIQFRYTNELTQGEVADYCKLFENVFHKGKCPQSFLRQFTTTCRGHSFHALLLHHSDGLVGAFTVSPEIYVVDGVDQVFGLSVDTMIHPSHRNDPLHFKRMADTCATHLIEQGIHFVFGFPNDQSRVYFEKVLRWRRMGELPYFCLPVRIGRFVPALAVLDRGYRCLLRAGTWLGSRLASDRTIAPSIEPQSRNTPGRLLRIQGRQILNLKGGGIVVYSVHNEGPHLSVCYLVDVQPLSPKSIWDSVGKLLALELDIDVFAYLGPLPFSPWPLGRLPGARVPKRIFMLGKPLPGANEGLLDISRWRVNLSTFDVR